MSSFNDLWGTLKEFVSELQIQEMDNENNHGALLMERVRSKMDFLEEYMEYAPVVNRELTNDSEDGNEKPRG
jgi:hypothetical protein